MACAAQSMLSASSGVFTPHKLQAAKKPFRAPGGASAAVVTPRHLRVECSAVSGADDSDCNVEECAPEKEVGKVSGGWLAGDRTKIAGTFPPKKKGWTGFVEKDTAGQTNIYSVEPTVYVAESAISSGAAGTSSEGSENTAAVAAGLALIAIATASSILIQLGRNQQPGVQSADYSGPPLSYYINKFKPVTLAQAAAAPPLQSSPSVEASVPGEQPEASTVETSATGDIDAVQVELKEAAADAGAIASTSAS